MADSLDIKTTGLKMMTLFARACRVAEMDSLNGLNNSQGYKLGPCLGGGLERLKVYSGRTKTHNRESR